jgi:RNA-directed DNA polymerase
MSTIPLIPISRLQQGDLLRARHPARRRKGDSRHLDRTDRGHRKSRRDRRWAKLNEITVELQRRMHQPIPEQEKWLRKVLAGYYAYHAVSTNYRSIRAFREQVTSLWRRTLRRRSQRHALSWKQMRKLADDWLPPPRIRHPWPRERFAVRHPRWEPYAGIPLVRIWGGGAQQ